MHLSSENPEHLSQLLAVSRVIAVVGLSPKPHRTSYTVAAYLQQQGYRIIPVNPREAGKRILGELCYASLTEASQEHKIDIVDCFRNAEDIPPIADETIAAGIPCLWMQSGIINQDAAEKARRAGIYVVMDQCLKIELMRLICR